MIERMSVMNRNRKLNRISKTVISGLLVTSLVAVSYTHLTLPTT